MFNCTSQRFVELREQLSNIEKGELQLNTFVAIKLAHDLNKATNLTKNLYGADVLVTYDLIKELLTYESRMHGLNLTHSQDKDYIYVSYDFFLPLHIITIFVYFVEYRSFKQCRFD